MRRIIAAILLISFAFCAFACKKIEDYIGKTGCILEKDHDAAYTTFIPNRIGNITILTPVYHKEKYKFKIQFAETEIIEWFEVTELIYESYEEGQLFTISEECRVL